VSAAQDPVPGKCKQTTRDIVNVVCAMQVIGVHYLSALHPLQHQGLVLCQDG